MELYFPDTACHYTDDPQAFILPRLPFLFRSRDRIWKNDRRTQRMDPGSAELPASSHDLFPGRILTDVLRYLPCQQLYASNHPDGYLPSRSVRYCKKNYKIVKTTFDLTCLTTTVVLSLQSSTDSTASESALSSVHF